MNFSEKYNAFMTLAHREVVRVLRIWTQTLLPPAITMGIYFVVFGNFLGSRIQPIGGFTYIQFILPGLVLMTTITNSFSNVASSFFSAKFQRNIEELLVSPIPDSLIVAGYAAGGIVRGVLTGVTVMGLGAFMTSVPVHSPAIVVVYLLLTATLFSLIGLTNGILARKFDDVSIVPTFVLTPLTYFAGVFYSIALLPPVWRTISRFNPIFYMVDGFRYGFLGLSDAPLSLGLTLLLVATGGVYGLNVYLVRRGIGLRS